MKIGILCGVAASATQQAIRYFDAIHTVGHEATIFTKGIIQLDHYSQTVYCHDNDEMKQLAHNSDCEFFIACNDNLGDLTTWLNVQRGKPGIKDGATHKVNVGTLSDKLQGIPSWNEIGDIPKGIPIFVKPNNGSGSKGGNDWNYQHYESVDHLQDYIDTQLNGGASRFEYAQANPLSLGKSVFQQYIPNEGWIYHHYLNDGVAKHWMKSFCQAPNPDAPAFNIITDIDAFDFAHHLTWGTGGSFQAFPNKNGKPYIFDFNVRFSAYWASVYKVICPDFFETFFDNLLNGKQNKYNFITDRFTIDPYGPEDSKIVITDYPSSGIHSSQSIIFK